MAKIQKEEVNFLEKLGLYFIGIIFLCALFEVGLLTYAYFNADKVECNLLWCTFTDVRDSKYYSNSFTECYVNGEKVNCSEIKDKEHFCFDDRCEINGVTTLEDFTRCMEERGDKNCTNI